MFRGACCRTCCRCRGCPATRRTSTLLHLLTSDLVNDERNFPNQSKYARGCSAIRQTSMLLRTVRKLLPRSLTTQGVELTGMEHSLSPLRSSMKSPSCVDRVEDVSPRFALNSIKLWMSWKSRLPSYPPNQLPPWVKT